MHKKKREIALSNVLRERAKETRNDKLDIMDKRCRPYTVILMWITVALYAIVIGAGLLYYLRT